mgnify:CR=1 FL=1
MRRADVVASRAEELRKQLAALPAGDAQRGMLEAEIATGEHSGMSLAARGTTAGHALNMTCDVLTQLARRTGETVYIPRIKLSPDDDNLPFAWSRRQFPVKIAFAMTSASPP